MRARLAPQHADLPPHPGVQVHHALLRRLYARHRGVDVRERRPESAAAAAARRIDRTARLDRRRARDVRALDIRGGRHPRRSRRPPRAVQRRHYRSRESERPAVRGKWPGTIHRRACHRLARRVRPSPAARRRNPRPRFTVYRRPDRPGPQARVPGGLIDFGCLIICTPMGVRALLVCLAFCLVPADALRSQQANLQDDAITKLVFGLENALRGGDAHAIESFLVPGGLTGSLADFVQSLTTPRPSAVTVKERDRAPLGSGRGRLMLEILTVYG